MNIENMRLWVARLRDPEAKQAFSTLRDDVGAMCCLGHAADVSRLGVWKSTCFYSIDGKTNGGFLPPPVMEWLGISERNPVIQGKALSEWNDENIKTLAEIADLLEEEDPELKV